MDNQEKEYYRKKLMGKRKSVLIKLAKLHDIRTEDCRKKTELVRRLLEQIFVNVQEFIDLASSMDKTGFIFYLDKVSRTYPEDFSNMELLNNDELLLFLWEKKDLRFLENLISLYRLKSEYTRKEFILVPESYKSVSTIKEETASFIQKYNETNRWKIDNEILDLEDDSIKMTFYIEVGKVFCQQFEFRLKEGPYNPDPLERKRTHYYPLDIRNVELRKISDSNYLLILDYDPEMERVWFDELLTFLFGKYSMEKANKTQVKRISRDVQRPLNLSPAIVTAIKAIEDIKETVNDCIDRSSLPESRKEAIKKIVNTIRYSSPFCKDEKIAAILYFRCQTEHETFKKTISDETINEILEKIPQSRENFFLTIGEKRKTILIEKGEYKQEVRLSRNEIEALRWFFEREDALRGS